MQQTLVIKHLQGDIVRAQTWSGGASNSIRGIIACGYAGPAAANVNTMDYVTLATLGNATDFGDSTWTGAYKSGASSPDRGVWMGGRTPGDYKNLIDYHQIMTTGNAQDFGDLVSNHGGSGSCSNGHGGL